MLHCCHHCADIIIRYPPFSPFFSFFPLTHLIEISNTDPSKKFDRTRHDEPLNNPSLYQSLSIKITKPFFLLLLSHTLFQLSDYIRLYSLCCLPFLSICIVRFSKGDDKCVCVCIGVCLCTTKIK